jgi:hypothetical protein
MTGHRFDLFDESSQDEDVQDAAEQNLLRLERQEKYLQRKPQYKLRKEHERKKAQILAWFDKHMIGIVDMNGAYELRIYIAVSLKDWTLGSWNNAIENLSGRFGEDTLLHHITVKGEQKLLMTLHQTTLPQNDVDFLNSMKNQCILSDWEQCKGQ